MGATVAHREGVFRHFAVEDFIGVIVAVVDGIERTRADAATATFAKVFVDDGLAVHIRDCVRAAFFCATPTRAAQGFLHVGFASVVLFHFACARATAHADVFNRTAKARHFVSFKMVKADENIGIHNGAPDFGVGDIFAARHRHFNVVGAAQSVANDDLAARCRWHEAVEHGAIEVFERVFAATGVEGVAIGQEGNAAFFFDEFHHDARVVCAQEGKVA